ncbi:hypothetical protein B0H13DRAFT_669910 [Mycena leptocephala]|nr:hypothetical protein B0H13DRAFT_669910 [Mycena leptocephala]
MTYRTALTKFVANLHVEGGSVSIPSIIPPVLTASSTVVRVPTPAARLKLSIVAVSGGLASSIFLLILVLPHLRQPVGRTPPLSGTGLLHIIWLLRNYPEVADLVPQVADPTDHSLRARGWSRLSRWTRKSMEAGRPAMATARNSLKTYF